MTPETHALRSYYSDFLIQKQDDSWIIAEVKADNMLDHPLIRAKADFAAQMAVTNGMTYKIIPGSQAEKGNYDYFFSDTAYPQQAAIPLI